MRRAERAGNLLVLGIFHHWDGWIIKCQVPSSDGLMVAVGYIGDFMDARSLYLFVRE